MKMLRNNIHSLENRFLTATAMLIMICSSFRLTAQQPGSNPARFCTNDKMIVTVSGRRAVKIGEAALASLPMELDHHSALLICAESAKPLVLPMKNFQNQGE